MVARGTAIGLAIVAVAAAVAGCGGSGAPSGSVLARAADASASAKGYTVQMSLHEAIPGAGTADITGTGAFSAPNHSGTMSMTAQVQGQDLQIQEILLGPTIYVKEPPSVAANLPGGKPWLELDLAKVGGQSYLSTLRSLMSDSSETNPADALSYLKAASSQIQDLGQATVAGVSTTHYRATLDLEKAGTGEPGSIHATEQKLLAQLPGKILNDTALPVDVWIDASHLVRRMSFTMKVVPNSTAQTVEVSLDLTMTGYGPQPTPTPPPASQTSNLLTLLQNEGQSGALSGG